MKHLAKIWFPMYPLCIGNKWVHIITFDIVEIFNLSMYLIDLNNLRGSAEK